MRTPRLFLGIFALALLLPLLLLACGGSDEPTAGPSSERATDEPETPASPGRTPSTPVSGDAPTATDTPATAPPAASGSADTDREALVALYNATDGENWSNNYNWLSDAPLGEWHGITTNDDGRVTELDLSLNDLSGKIPAELGSLSNLEILKLGNDLSGEIPAELGGLSNLTRLSLLGNALSGEIPAELGSLSNLKYLTLYDNALSGEIPTELGNLSRLAYLDLYDNDLSGCVPSSLEDQLDFDHSDLGDLPFC